MVQCDLYRRAVNAYGKTHQLGVAVEEMGEAIAKISQYTVRGREVEDEMVEEIADVVIMTMQMKEIYGTKLIVAINKKLNKLRMHVEEKEKQNGRV